MISVLPLVFTTHTHSTHTHRTQAHRQAMEVDKDDAIITSPDEKWTKVDKPGDDDSDDDDVSIPPYPFALHVVSPFC